jgi:glycosyltransferase involved in cell wall biosynthesis
MRAHVLAVPHTVTHPDWSHCAFTQKALKLSPMLRAHGWDVLHYGVAGSTSGATEDVVLMDQGEHQDLLGHPYDPHGTTFFGQDATDGSPLYRQWNLYAREELKARVEPGDLILCPFGHAHAAAIRDLPQLAQGAGAVESGIGYFDCLLPWRVYESYAVRHATMAKEGRYGVQPESTRLEWVIPNSYDERDWPEGPGGDAIVFMARLTEGKGVATVIELAKALPDQPFVLAGQGDIDAFGPLPANVDYVGPVVGAKRAELLGQAKAVIAPSRYIEPFGGVVVEAAFCGTPAITSDFGAFAETVLQGITGWRCQTLTQYIEAVELVGGLKRRTIAQRARRMYGLHRVGQLYDRALQVARGAALAGRFPSTGW